VNLKTLRARGKCLSLERRGRCIGIIRFRQWLWQGFDRDSALEKLHWGPQARSFILSPDTSQPVGKTGGGGGGCVSELRIGAARFVYYVFPGTEARDGYLRVDPPPKQN